MKTLLRSALALTIALPLAFVAQPSVAQPARAADDILTTAAKAGNFKTLGDAIKAADLTETLKAKGPFTVFAPTDEAFAKLPKEKLEALMKPENKRWLVSLLGAHVLSGKALKSDRIAAAKNFNVKMLNGSNVEIDTKKGVTFGKGTVTKADIDATNGVIHVVDAVYVPKRVTAALYVADKTAKAKAAAASAAAAAKAAGSKAMDAAKSAGEKAKAMGGKALDAAKDVGKAATEKAKSMTSPSPAPAPAPEKK
jgi:uncharacterized surface protein with fasciclin (FAS1) repeats